MRMMHHRNDSNGSACSRNDVRAPHTLWCASFKLARLRACLCSISTYTPTYASIHAGSDKVSDATKAAFTRRPSPTPLEHKFPPSPNDLAPEIKKIAFPDDVLPPDVSFPELEYNTGRHSIRNKKAAGVPPFLSTAPVPFQQRFRMLPQASAVPTICTHTHTTSHFEFVCMRTSRSSQTYSIQSAGAQMTAL